MQNKKHGSKFNNIYSRSQEKPLDVFFDLYDMTTFKVMYSTWVFFPHIENAHGIP